MAGIWESLGMYLEIVDSESGSCLARAWRRDPAPRMGDRITYLGRTIGSVVEHPVAVSGLDEHGAIVSVRASARRVCHRHAHSVATTYDLGSDVIMSVVRIAKSRLLTHARIKRGV